MQKLIDSQGGNKADDLKDALWRWQKPGKEK